MVQKNSILKAPIIKIDFKKIQGAKYKNKNNLGANIKESQIDNGVDLFKGFTNIHTIDWIFCTFLCFSQSR